MFLNEACNELFASILVFLYGWIGISYYPQWSEYGVSNIHQPLKNLIENNYIPKKEKKHLYLQLPLYLQFAPNQ